MASLIRRRDQAMADDAEEMEDGNFGVFIVIITAGLFAFVAILHFTRVLYRRKYGVDLCPRYKSPQSSEEIRRDREIAEELHRRILEADREAEREVKRKERIVWYESYLKPFSMTVKSEDLFYLEDNVENSTADKTQDAEDPELGLSPPICEEIEKSHCLRLPVQNETGRVTDAQCAICVCDYEAGDNVVWSGLECKHAFHHECILPWLSKGKKRCPTCRHWFVPGAKIEDQKKELEDRLRAESDLPVDSEAEEIEEQSMVDREESAGVAVARATSSDIEDGELSEGSDDESCVRRLSSEYVIDETMHAKVPPEDAKDIQYSSLADLACTEATGSDLIENEDTDQLTTDAASTPGVSLTA